MQTVTITTTKKLTEEQLKTVKSLVEPKLGKVSIEEVIEPNIIGGIKITVGNQEFDASLSGRLEKLELETDKAVVTTAIPLTADHKKQIISHIEKKYGISEIKAIIDPSIIGGIKIRVGSKEVDHTIKNKLTQLSLQLLEKI